MPILKTFDKRFFKKWSADMAYILGFMYADGNMVKSKRGTHFVAIYTSDRSLLSEMRKRLRSDHKISEKKSATGACYRLQIGSFELFEDLERLGLVVNKTTRMKIPTIPKKFMADFVRGYFDGDGNIWTGVLHTERKFPSIVLFAAFTSCSYEFLASIKMTLRSLGIVGGSLFRSRVKNFSRLQFGTADSLKLYEIMYNDDTSLELKRKRKIFEKFIRLRA
jgi:hypothetical protein